MKLLRLLVVLGLCCSAFGAMATAQSQQPASSSGPPEMLVLVHQEFQFGKEGAQEQLETAIARACDQITVPNSWIELESITGKPEALSFDPFDSFAHVDDAVAGWNQIYATNPGLAHMQGELRALETSERTIIAVRRGDLSYQASSIDLSKARFMRVLEVNLRPGHEDEFAEAFKILRAAYLKINADLPWVVYQVNVGTPTPAFYVFVPMRALKQNDDLLSWRGMLREAEGNTGAGRMQQIARDAYISTESNLYAINPQISHVSKEFAAGDPEFWSPRPQSSAKPSENKPEAASSSQMGTSAKPKQ
jgi:hypothetical protein